MLRALRYRVEKPKKPSVIMHSSSIWVYDKSSPVSCEPLTALIASEASSSDRESLVSILLTTLVRVRRDPREGGTLQKPFDFKLLLELYFLLLICIWA